MVLAAAVYLALGYAFGPILLFPAIGMYTVARWLPIRRSSVAAGLGLLLLAIHAVVAIGQGMATTDALRALPWAGWLLVPWTAGTLLRTYRESLRHAREEEVRERAYEERLRVAREVNDVVGHGLAAINMQAGVALHVFDRRPEQARAALEAIRATSKDALDDLRVTLAVSRQPDGQGDRRPAAGLDQLDMLINRITEGGLAVDLSVTGDPVRLPTATDLAAYRIVQESLANVVRHAGPATAAVHVHYGPAEVLLDIADNGAGVSVHGPATGGYGVPGMRERAAAVGGTLEAGPRPEGGFRVQARLPLGGESLS
ncbi:MAG: sensor histidine kinase [Streptosporangiales bacterium]|nr:sensor histidine kinase [Streptosporangiales bacterium]